MPDGSLSYTVKKSNSGWLPCQPQDNEPEELLPTNESRRKPALSSLSNSSEPPSPTSKATGPRTSAGKRRTRYNAVQRGIFAKIPLLPFEPPAEYERLLKGMRDLWQPQNVVEATLVEKLAFNLWRQRRLILAETAESTQAIQFGPMDSLLARAGECWDRSRAGESGGGMLRPTLNPWLVKEAKAILETFRDAFEANGFEQDAWLLRMLYGVDQDGIIPVGPFYLFEVCAKTASSIAKEGKTSNAPVILKKLVLEVLDGELERLKIMEGAALYDDQERGSLQRIVASVPSHDVSERFIRYGTHLDREYDRIWSQLERCQQLRLGQPSPPAVRVELS